MDNFNIVLIGENFPISSVDLADFDFLGRPVRERVRLPVLLEAQAGEFALTVLPERFQVGVADTRETPDKVEAVKSCAWTFLDYAGRRTITAVGHNFQQRVRIGDVSRLGPLVGYDALRTYLGLEDAPVVDIEVGFRRGNETRARLKVVQAKKEDSVLLDFNFHYATGKADERQDVRQAIDSFGDSLALAQELVDRFPSAISVGENA